MGHYPRLRDLREDKDLSIRRLAVTLAKFYNVSLDYIGGLTNDSTPPNNRAKK